MINWCIESGVTFCEEFILFSLMEFMSEKRFKGAKQLGIKILMSCVAASFIIFLNSTVSLFSFFTLIIGSVVPAFLAKSFCKGKMISFTSISIVYFLVITIVDFMLLYIVEYLFITDFVVKVMTTTGLERTCYIICSKLLLITAYFVFTRLFKHKINELSTKFLMIVDVSSVVYYVCLNIVIGCIISDDIVNVKRSIVVALLFMIAFLAFNIFFLKRYSEERKKQAKYDMAEYQKQIIQKNYLSLNEMYRKNAKNMHDYRNNLQVISGLMSNQKYDEAQSYINDLDNEINKDKTLHTYTGVEIVDAVLNVKVNTACKKKVKIDVRASYPLNSTIKQVDICAILGNLLDNAIEACEKIENVDDRLISVKISYANSIIAIRIENKVAENPFKASKKLYTTKQNKKIHGLGIGIVRRTVDKYFGDMKQSCDNNVFVTEIILYTDRT